MWWTSKQIFFERVYNFIHLCRIEAMEKKHNREWEEDYGTDRPKSPKSSPKVPSPRTTPTPKAKSSRKDRQQCLLFKMHESCVSFWNQRGARVLLHSPSFSALSLSAAAVCCAAFYDLFFMPMKSTLSLRKMRRTRRTEKWVWGLSWHCDSCCRWMSARSSKRKDKCRISFANHSFTTYVCIITPAVYFVGRSCWKLIPAHFLHHLKCIRTAWMDSFLSLSALFGWDDGVWCHCLIWNHPCKPDLFISVFSIWLVLSIWGETAIVTQGTVSCVGSVCCDVFL